MFCLRSSVHTRHENYSKRHSHTRDTIWRIVWSFICKKNTENLVDGIHGNVVEHFVESRTDFPDWRSTLNDLMYHVHNVI